MYKKTFLLFMVIVVSLALTSCMFYAGNLGSSPHEDNLFFDFEENGGSLVDQLNIPYGEIAQRPLDPIKDGFSFDGWYLDQNFELIYDWSEEVESDLILYAKWVEDNEN